VTDFVKQHPGAPTGFFAWEAAGLRWLSEFDNQGGVQPPEGIVQQGFRLSTACRALWQAALGSTMKCFQHSESRAEKLDSATIFGSDTTQPVRAAFDLLNTGKSR
jgi:hypothetical protein